MMLNDIQGFFKRHWVSILLDGGITPEELFALIDASHALTGGPRRHRMPLAK